MAKLNIPTPEPCYDGKGGSYLLDPLTGKKSQIDPPTQDKTYERGSTAITDQSAPSEALANADSNIQS